MTMAKRRRKTSADDDEWEDQLAPRPARLLLLTLGLIFVCALILSATVLAVLAFMAD